MNRSGWWWVFLLACCFVCGPLLWPVFFAGSTRDTGQATPTATLVPPWPTPTSFIPQEGTPFPSPSPWKDERLAQYTLETLQATEIPIHDPIAFVREVLGRPVVVATATPGPSRQVGETDTFYVMDMETHEAYTITARLVYVTPHAYFWVQEGVSYDLEDVRTLMDTFETRIYPTTRRYFGSEWRPGVDGDPHIYILYVKRLGGGVAGYFASSDEWPPEVHPYSNQHEMFVFSASSTSLDDPWTFGLLAHEFQHMIHWYQDRNEPSWVNEGASELAVHLNGYPTGSSETIYLAYPDLQLNAWPDPQRASTLPHYGASFLFLLYFWERFGDAALQSLVAQDADGWDGVDAVLQELGLDLTHREVFLDWLVANVVQDPDLEDGRFGYRTYTLPDRPASDVWDTCPGEREASVMPFGMDLYRLECPGVWDIRLDGEPFLPLWPTPAHSGNFAFWSNYGDESEMRLTRKFDLTDVQGPVTLTYWTWYNIEPNYDYVYLLASRDGRRWELLRPPSATDENPTGNNYGWGYTGISGGGDEPAWIQEAVDLSAYAGGPVWIRFVYVTDAAVNREGFVVDDVAIEALGYQEDFEQDSGGWQAQGFVRVANRLPAEYRWILVTMGPSGTQVRFLPMETPYTGRATVEVPQEGKTYLLITLLTRYTRQPGLYRLAIQGP